jgi:hypothetical protein
LPLGWNGGKRCFGGVLRQNRHGKFLSSHLCRVYSNSVTFPP